MAKQTIPGVKFGTITLALRRAYPVDRAAQVIRLHAKFSTPDHSGIDVSSIMRTFLRRHEFNPADDIWFFAECAVED